MLCAGEWADSAGSLTAMFSAAVRSMKEVGMNRSRITLAAAALFASAAYLAQKPRVGHDREILIA